MLPNGLLTPLPSPPPPPPGVKEVTLLGQNVNSYRDLSESSIPLYDGDTTHLSKGFRSIYRSREGGRRFADLLHHVSLVRQLCDGEKAGEWLRQGVGWCMKWWIESCGLCIAAHTSWCVRVCICALGVAGHPLPPSSPPPADETLCVHVFCVCGTEESVVFWGRVFGPLVTKTVSQPSHTTYCLWESRLGPDNRDSIQNTYKFPEFV